MLVHTKYLWKLTIRKVMERLINFKKITVIQTTQSNHKAIKISITIMTGNYTHPTPLF